MTKNIKRMFFVLTLVTLLVTVGAVSAADDANSTAATDNSVSDVASVSDTTSDTIAAEPVQTTNDDNKVDTKMIEKEDKNIKKDPVTIDGVTYNIVYQNMSFYNDLELDDNTIFDNCTFSSWMAMELTITRNMKAILNNCNVDFTIYMRGNSQIIINNSYINSEQFYGSNSATVIIDDNTKTGSDFNMDYFGTILTNNTDILNSFTKNRIYLGNQIIENQNITQFIQNYGNLTIKNTTINAQVQNYGNLTIEDDVKFDENCQFNKNGTYIISDINKIASLMIEYHGEYNFNNVTIRNNPYRTNYGTITFSNSIIDSNFINYGTIIINDDTTFGENFVIKGNGSIIINDTSKLFPYQQDINDDMTLENMNITYNKTNNANTTFINCNINGFIINNANITFINCSFSNNNMNKSSLYPSSGYLLDNKGTARLENCIIENNTFNYTSSNNYDRVNGAIVNNGTMTVVNTIARNNSLGYYNVTDTLYHGNAVGKGSALANYGNLSVELSNFTDNYAGLSGGSIYNEANLTVTDSLFENNLANLYGGAISSSYLTIYNPYGTYDGQMNIINSKFKNNKVILPLNELDVTGGGAINSRRTNMTINNCTFDSNEATTDITGLMGVTAYGSAIAIQNGKTNITALILNSTFTNHKSDIIHNGKWGYDIYNGSVENCIFENNNATAIFDVGNLNITNNIFQNNKNSEEIIKNYIRSLGAQKVIENNQFINNNATADTINTVLTGDYSNSTTLNITVTNNTYSNTTINDTIDLTIPSKIYTGEPITITGTYTINTPDNYDSDILEQNKFNIYINGVLDQTVDTLDFTVTPTAGTMMVTVQPTISQTRKTQAIRATTLTDITITPENYNEYIYEGVLVGVSKDTRVKFSGEFTDKGDIVFDTNDLIIDGTNATFTNTTFTLDNENITLTNMNINNNEIQYTITNAFNNNIIANNTITVTNTQTTGAAIYNTASNTLIENNTITQTAPAYDIDFSTGQGVASTQAILLLGGDKNTVQNNNINIKASSSSAYGTLEAITNNNDATNTIITQNTINISGANFNYAIDSLNNVDNITITENTITVTGERYCDGIQAGNGATNIVVDNNNITCICINTTELTTEGAITYGVIATSMGSEESENITITNNNIDITGTANYGIELYKVSNTEVHNNTITVNGPFSMGIGYGYSSNGNATGNTITTTGDSTTPINQITEEFKPENVGIRIQNGTNNISITDNTITTSDVGGQDTTIHSEPDNVTIANNQLTSSQGYGDDTIKAPTTATIENNTIETTTTIEVPETIITKTPTTITANVTTIDGTPINGGTITFTQGNEAISQAEVIDGVATATVTFKEAEDTTIVASYTPESSGLTTSSAEAATSIQTPQTQLTIEDVNLTAGETVTLTATVTDQTGNNITGGKVTFKVNGKTVKDTNGKVIYAKVVDGVATVEYIVPDNLSGKDVNITAVYSGSTKYNKESTTITKTATAQETTLTITPITDDVQTGSTITLKAKIAAGDKAITTGKIVFKINGKTVKDENGKVIYAKVDANGEVSIDYNLGNLKAGSYTIEATFISPNYDKITSNTTMTVVKA